MKTRISEGGQKWFIRFACQSHNPAGKRISWTKTNPESLIPGMKPAAWLSANLPAAFHGCEVHITTPIHHNTAVVDPDHPHTCRYLS